MKPRIKKLLRTPILTQQEILYLDDFIWRENASSSMAMQDLRTQVSRKLEQRRKRG